MTLFTITLTSPISDDYSNRTLPSIRELRCSMHRPRSLTSDIIVVAPAFKNKVLQQSIILRPDKYNTCTETLYTLPSNDTHPHHNTALTNHAISESQTHAS